MLAMKLNDYLAHRRRYELTVVSALLLLVVVVNATTKGLESIRAGQPPNWFDAFGTEFTSVLVTGLLIIPLVSTYRRLDLRLGNIKWRITWLLPIFIGFSLLHIAGFVLLRKALWAAFGGEYSFDPWLLNLFYEMRKDLLSFIQVTGVYYGYIFIIGRLQGEASFVDQMRDQESDQDSDRESEQQGDRYRQQFLVKMLDREYLVRVQDIDWVQSASNYVLLHCGGKDYPMRQTLKGLSEQLDPSQFQRAHRTAIVNMARVDCFVEQGESVLQLRSGDKVPVSKTYMPALKAALTGPATAVAAGS